MVNCSLLFMQKYTIVNCLIVKKDRKTFALNDNCILMHHVHYHIINRVQKLQSQRVFLWQMAYFTEKVRLVLMIRILYYGDMLIPIM